MKNYVDFIHKLSSLLVGLQDIRISFDVVLLFTRVPIRKAMHLPGQHFEEDILRLFCSILISSVLWTD
jgi:hypothetical protein